MAIGERRTRADGERRTRADGERRTRADGERRTRADGARRGSAADELEPIRDDLRQAQSEMRALGFATGEVAREFRVLLMKEAGLAQAEMADSRSAATKAGIIGGFAGVAGLLVLGFLALAMMFGFDTIMPQWLAALATAGVLALIALLSGFVARRQLKDSTVTPRRALRSMREDVQWAREQIRRNGQ